MPASFRDHFSGHAARYAAACRWHGISTVSSPDVVDLVAVAQAHHWFGHADFCAQARRVLKPCGVIALWSYARSQVNDEVDALFDQLHDEILATDPAQGRIVQWPLLLRLGRA